MIYDETYNASMHQRFGIRLYLSVNIYGTAACVIKSAPEVLARFSLNICDC